MSEGVAFLNRMANTLVRNLKPSQLRMFFDLALAYLGTASAVFFFKTFSLPSGPLFPGLFLAPVLLCLIAASFGLYGRRRMSSIATKLVLLGLSLILVSVILISLGMSPSPVVLWALMTAVPLFIPRCIVGVSLSGPSMPLASALRANGPVLVVGGAGYIGIEVVQQLLSRGYAVRVLDKLVYGRSSLGAVVRHPRFSLIEGDTTDIAVITRALDGVSAVVHLAGLVGDPACSVDETFTRHLNIISTRMVKEIAKSFGVSRFVFASSCSVYGIADEILNEESPTNPVSLYARTKIDSEKELLAERGQNFHPVILRFATVFGHSARPRFDLVANLFTAQAFNEGTIRVFGKDQWRPFVHVRDVARAIVLAIEADSSKVAGQIFNVGDSELNVTIGQLAQLVKNVVSKVRDVKVDESASDFKDARNYAVSFDKIARVLGFRAQVSLENGVREILSHFQRGGYEDYRSSRFSNVEVTRQIVNRFYDPEHSSRLYAPVREA